ncbi:YraN family protein [Croceiramulus getboli]|nr:YraN family protein [Flavobacteriaceae bacterium YJPT1-3]
MNPHELGLWGEQRAVNYLLGKQYDILERNWRFKRTEIDIIAQQEELLVICEVKTRNSDFFGDPQSFVTPTQIKHLVKAADEFIRQNALDLEVRFDIIAILKNKREERLEHFPDAFYHF